MKACRAASVVAIAALSGASMFAACAQAPRPDVPPVTVAYPDGAAIPGPTPSTIMRDAVAEGGAPVDASVSKEPPLKASFIDLPASVGAATCSRAIVAVAKGKATLLGETLSAGDALVIAFPEPLEIKGSGLVLFVSERVESAACLSKPPLDKKVVRASAAPELKWAGGTMSAHLDVGAKLSPDVYLGRLEGTAAVAEHAHPGNWEILAAVEASGTFVLEGTEGRLGPRQIVFVPPGAKHAWKPEQGAKLVAIQMYSPPGPEQRFVALAAADKDASAPKDAGTEGKK